MSAAAGPATSPEIWLLRHGATEWARDGRHTGRTDLPLLPEGEDEARRLAPLLAARGFDAVLVSPRLRARRTCDLAGLGEQAEVCDDLLVLSTGTFSVLGKEREQRALLRWNAPVAS